MNLITDNTHAPTMEELTQYVENPMFPALCAHMTQGLGALVSVDYSGDTQLLGWNVRFRKGSRTLLRVYPNPGYVKVLVVIGRKEKERTEALLPGMSEAMQVCYRETKEGMGQRWLLLELHAHDELYDDILRLAELRRDSGKALGELL